MTTVKMPMAISENFCASVMGRLAPDLNTKGGQGRYRLIFGLNRT